MKKLFLIFFVLCVYGCALRHTAEIGRLEDYGANMDEQKSSIKKCRENFEKLLGSVKKADMSAYATQEDFRKDFGEPVFIKNVSGRNDYSVLWLYRYCEKLGGSEKVYLYFDAAGNLVSWEYVPGEKKP